MPSATKSNFFNAEHQTKTKKKDRDDSAFLMIAGEEQAAREKKTAKLRELRLQRDAEQALITPAPKTRRAKAAKG